MPKSRTQHLVNMIWTRNSILYVGISNASCTADVVTPTLQIVHGTSGSLSALCFEHMSLTRVSGCKIEYISERV